MFRLHLHPTPSGFLFGIALIGFWALLWLFFLAQLPRPQRVATAQPAPLVGALEDRHDGVDR